MSIISQTSIPGSSADLISEDLPCDASVAIGDWVRFDSGVLVKAIATDIDTSNVIGIVESKATSVLATIRLGGVTQVLSGLDNSTEYLLSPSTAGGMTPLGVDVPSASGSALLILGKAISLTRFYINVGNRIIRS